MIPGAMPHWNGIVVAGTIDELKPRFRDPDGQLKKPSDVENDLREAARPCEVVVSWETGKYNRRASVTILCPPDHATHGREVLEDFGAREIRELKSSSEKDRE